MAVTTDGMVSLSDDRDLCHNVPVRKERFVGFPTGKTSMALDKKSKKRLEVIRKKIDKLQLQLAGAKEQNDEPGDVERIDKELADLTAELRQLKS